MVRYRNQRSGAPRDRYAFLVVGTFACLAAGLLTVYLSRENPAAAPAPSTAQALPAAAVPDAASSTEPVTVLTLVVDDRLAPQPRLLGCWVLTFQEGTRQYYLLGFPADTPVDATHSLRDYYDADRNLEDKSRFVEEALKVLTQGGLKIRYHVYLDLASLAGLVDRVGGVDLDPGGPAVAGADLLAQQAALPLSDPGAQIEFQRRALGGFARAYQARAWSEAELRRLLDEFQSLSPDSFDLFAIAVRAGPLADATITVQVANRNP